MCKLTVNKKLLVMETYENNYQILKIVSRLCSEKISWEPTISKSLQFRAPST